MNAGPALLALLLAAPAAAQISIDSHGIRTGDTSIDATGVHTRGTTVDRHGVRTGGGGRVINGNHLTQRIDCAGGALTVNGNANRLTLANCRTITVAGNHNIIAARFASPGRLTVTGNDDQVTYSVAPRVSVAVSNVGSRSRIDRN